MRHRASGASQEATPHMHSHTRFHAYNHRTATAAAHLARALRGPGRLGLDGRRGAEDAAATWRHNAGLRASHAHDEAGRHTRRRLAKCAGSQHRWRWREGHCEEAPQHRALIAPRAKRKVPGIG